MKADNSPREGYESRQLATGRRAFAWAVLSGAVFIATGYGAGAAGRIEHLSRQGLRSDALLLMSARDASAVVAMLTCGALLSVLVSRSRRFVKPLAALFVLSLCGVLLSAYLEVRLRTRVHDNLEQFRRAVENYHLRKPTVDGEPD